MRVGGQAVIASCTIILCMIMIGIFVGWMFDWQRMDCIYLGGMLAMSSTTIIYKAFDDMGIRQQRFTGIVLSILILEDILAIVLMVMLSTLAVSTNFEGSEMIYSIMKLAFFLILWFVVGIYLIPLFLKRSSKFLSNETLLIVSLALCFGMVYLAALVGFSPAFGAFIMGSILAETTQSEQISRLVSPVKDLFGAIFFVSVGMMVDPHMIMEYKIPIIVIVLSVLLGQTIFGTAGVLLSGQPLKISMQCGFSLTQIGEFAFIIASLGVSLHVTSDFLYPIVVAVSVITTFMTPYMIRLAVPTYNIVNKRLPDRWKRLLDRYTSGTSTTAHTNNWKKLIINILRIVSIYSVLSIAITILCLQIVVPLATDLAGDLWGKIIGFIITIIVIAPFLRALIMKKNHSPEFRSLWADNRFNHAPLISVILLRIVIAMGFIIFIIEELFHASAALIVGIAIVLVCGIIFSRFLKKQSIVLERTFMKNLNSKELQEEDTRTKQPDYAGKLLERDLHLSDFEVPADSLWTGKTLKELAWGKKYDVHVASVIRGNYRINIPGGDLQIFPNDTLQIIGTDKQLATFAQLMKEVRQTKDTDFSKHEMKLKQFAIDKKSSLIGHSIVENGIRSQFHCLVVGIETNGSNLLHTPDPKEPLKENDVMWVVGEETDLNKLLLSCSTSN